MNSFLFLTSNILGILGYVYYFFDVKGSHIKSNKWSWLIWSFTMLIETLTFNEISKDFWKSGIFFISTACCVVVSTLIWSKSKWQKPHWTEFVCVSVSIVSAVLWLVFNLTVWAHLIVVISLPIAFIPTYRDAWNNFKHEDTPSWLLWVLGDFFALLLIIFRYEKFEDLPYIIAEFLSHFFVWFIVFYKKELSEKYEN